MAHIGLPHGVYVAEGASSPIPGMVVVEFPRFPYQLLKIPTVEESLRLARVIGAGDTVRIVQESYDYARERRVFVVEVIHQEPDLVEWISR